MSSFLVPKLSTVALGGQCAVQAFQSFEGNKQEIRKSVCCVKYGSLVEEDRGFSSSEAQHMDPPLVIVFGNLTLFFPRLFAPTACGWRPGTVETKSCRGEGFECQA